MVVLKNPLYLKCGFLLAEEERKPKTLFSCTPGSLGSSVWGGGLDHMTQFKAQFVCCHSPLPDMPACSKCFFKFFSK